ncbi:MAG: hypothetical protein IID18_04495 [Nitrospinae bacterium]|nr:hypothetical protein [Nitrospinota bacterium]
MNVLVEWFGLDPAEFNEVGLRWTMQDLTSVWIVVLILVPLALWFSWTSLQRIQSLPRKIFLIALRAFTFAVLVFLLLKPELEFRKSHALKNTVAVLLDDSKSLSIKTFPSEAPRIDFVRRTLEKNREVLESLREKFQVDYFLVSDRIEPIPSAEIPGRYRPKNASTDIGKIFSQLKKRYEGKSLQGVMLFSDGADLTMESDSISSELLNLLADWGGPGACDFDGDGVGIADFLELLANWGPCP